MKKALKGLLIIVLFTSFTLLTGCVTVDNGDENGGTKEKNKSLELAETFKFDDLEITLGKEISFTKLDNKYSYDYGKDVVKLPITVKNLKDETHSLNMFYYKIYGATGVETDEVNSYFDDNIDSAGDLRTGATYTKNIYFLYDENGTYAIEFNDWFTKIMIEFEVSK